MGGEYVDREVGTASAATGYSAAAQAVMEKTAADPACDPKNRTVSSNATTPIVIAMDVTSSRGNDSKILYDKAPMYFGQLLIQGYLNDPEISFCAVGDATDSDVSPLQICDFAKGNGLDPWLERLWLEEGGGGSGCESYELAAYYYAYQSELQCTESGGKGYFFITGDEAFYPEVIGSQVLDLIGNTEPMGGAETMDAAVVWEALQEKFNVFLLYPVKSLDDKKANIDQEIMRRLQREGAQTGEVAVSLMWSDWNDLDLHVECPCGTEIYYGKKKCESCGGWLDVDMNAGGASSEEPVENVFWGLAPVGTYKVYVQNYALKGDKVNPCPWKIQVKVGNEYTIHEGATSNLKTNNFVCDINYTGKTDNEGEYAAYEDATILGKWGEVIPAENIITLGSPKAIVDAMLGVVALTEGKRDLEKYIDDLTERGQTEERKAHITAALTPLDTVIKGGSFSLDELLASMGDGEAAEANAAEAATTSTA